MMKCQQLLGWPTEKSVKTESSWLAEKNARHKPSVVGEEGGVHSGQFGGQEGMDAEDERLQVCALQLLV